MSQQQGDIQERIAAARREAENLKEKIRTKKESSADTSCKSIIFWCENVVSCIFPSACDGRRG